MNTPHVGPGGGHRPPAPLRHAEKAEHGKAHRGNKHDVAPPQAETESSVGPVPEPETSRSEKVPGVIRLLEEGHFKGVADVRLRINFFDELSARTAAQSGSVARAQADELVAEMRTKVDELIAPLAGDASTQALIDEQITAFDITAAEAVSESVTQKGVDTSGLQAALAAAFETLVGELRSALTPLEVPESEDESTATVPPVEETVPISAGPEAPAALAVSTETLDSAAPVSSASDQVVFEAATSTAAELDPSAVEVAPETAGVPVPTDGPATTPVDTSTTSEDPIETVTPLDQALTDLTAAFDTYLTQLIGAIQTSQQLPDPSAPSGHGSAYDKFLAMYNELRGITPQVDAKG